MHAFEGNYDALRDKCIDMGAIVDKSQYDSVMDYIRIAKEDEGELQQGACSEHARLGCSQPLLAASQLFACSQPTCSQPACSQPACLQP